MTLEANGGRECEPALVEDSPPRLHSPRGYAAARVGSCRDSLFELQAECRIRSSRRIAEVIYREIREAGVKKRKSQAFVKDIYNKLLFLHDVHQEIKEKKKRFPFSKVLIKVVVEYIQLEHNALYAAEGNNLESEKEVESRVINLLENLFLPYDKKPVPSRCANPNSLFVLKVLYAVASEYRTDNNLFGKLVRKLLKKLDLWNTVKRSTMGFCDISTSNPAVKMLSQYDINELPEEYDTDDEEALTLNCELSKLSLLAPSEQCLPALATQENTSKLEKPLIAKEQNVDPSGAIETICLDDVSDDSDDDPVVVERSVKTHNSSDLNTSVTNDVQINVKSSVKLEAMQSTKSKPSEYLSKARGNKAKSRSSKGFASKDSRKQSRQYDLMDLPPSTSRCSNVLNATLKNGTVVKIKSEHQIQIVIEEDQDTENTSKPVSQQPKLLSRRLHRKESKKPAVSDNQVNEISSSEIFDMENNCEPTRQDTDFSVHSVEITSTTTSYPFYQRCDVSNVEMPPDSIDQVHTSFPVTRSYEKYYDSVDSCLTPSVTTNYDERDSVNVPPDIQPNKLKCSEQNENFNDSDKPVLSSDSVRTDNVQSNLNKNDSPEIQDSSTLDDVRQVIRNFIYELIDQVESAEVEKRNDLSTVNNVHNPSDNQNVDFVKSVGQFTNLSEPNVDIVHNKTSSNNLNEEFVNDDKNCIDIDRLKVCDSQPELESINLLTQKPYVDDLDETPAKDCSNQTIENVDIILNQHETLAEHDVVIKNNKPVQKLPHQKDLLPVYELVSKTETILNTCQTEEQCHEFAVTKNSQIEEVFNYDNFEEASNEVTIESEPIESVIVETTLENPDILTDSQNVTTHCEQQWNNVESEDTVNTSDVLDCQHDEHILEETCIDDQLLINKECNHQIDDNLPGTNSADNKLLNDQKINKESQLEIPKEQTRDIVQDELLDHERKQEIKPFPPTISEESTDKIMEQFSTENDQTDIPNKECSMGKTIEQFTSENDKIDISNIESSTDKTIEHFTWKNDQTDITNIEDTTDKTTEQFTSESQQTYVSNIEDSRDDKIAGFTSEKVEIDINNIGRSADKIIEQFTSESYQTSVPNIKDSTEKTVEQLTSENGQPAIFNIEGSTDTTIEHCPSENDQIDILDQGEQVSLNGDVNHYVINEEVIEDDVNYQFNTNESVIEANLTDNFVSKVNTPTEYDSTIECAETEVESDLLISESIPESKENMSQYCSEDIHDEIDKNLKETEVVSLESEVLSFHISDVSQISKNHSSETDADKYLVETDIENIECACEVVETVLDDDPSCIANESIEIPNAVHDSSDVHSLNTKANVIENFSFYNSSEDYRFVNPESQLEDKSLPKDSSLTELETAKSELEDLYSTPATTGCCSITYSIPSTSDETERPVEIRIEEVPAEKPNEESGVTEGKRSSHNNDLHVLAELANERTYMPVTPETAPNDGSNKQVRSRVIIPNKNSFLRKKRLFEKTSSKSKVNFKPNEFKGVVGKQSPHRVYTTTYSIGQQTSSSDDSCDSFKDNLIIAEDTSKNDLTKLFEDASFKDKLLASDEISIIPKSRKDAKETKLKNCIKQKKEKGRKNLKLEDNFVVSGRCTRSKGMLPEEEIELPITKKGKSGLETLKNKPLGSKSKLPTTVEEALPVEPKPNKRSTKQKNKSVDPIAENKTTTDYSIESILNIPYNLRNGLTIERLDYPPHLVENDIPLNLSTKTMLNPEVSIEVINDTCRNHDLKVLDIPVTTTKNPTGKQKDRQNKQPEKINKFNLTSEMEVIEYPQNQEMSNPIKFPECVVEKIEPKPVKKESPKKEKPNIWQPYQDINEGASSSRELDAEITKIDIIMDQTPINSKIEMKNLESSSENTNKIEKKNLREKRKTRNTVNKITENLGEEKPHTDIKQGVSSSKGLDSEVPKIDFKLGEIPVNSKVEIKHPESSIENPNKIEKKNLKEKRKTRNNLNKFTENLDEDKLHGDIIEEGSSLRKLDDELKKNDLIDQVLTHPIVEIEIPELSVQNTKKTERRNIKEKRRTRNNANKIMENLDENKRLQDIKDGVNSSRELGTEVIETDLITDQMPLNSKVEIKTSGFSFEKTNKIEKKHPKEKRKTRNNVNKKAETLNEHKLHENINEGTSSLRKLDVEVSKVDLINQASLNSKVEIKNLESYFKTTNKIEKKNLKEKRKTRSNMNKILKNFDEDKRYQGVNEGASSSRELNTEVTKNNLIIDQIPQTSKPEINPESSFQNTNKIGRKNMKEKRKSRNNINKIENFDKEKERSSEPEILNAEILCSKFPSDHHHDTRKENTLSQPVEQNTLQPYTEKRQKIDNKRKSKQAILSTPASEKAALENMKEKCLSREIHALGIHEIDTMEVRRTRQSSYLERMAEKYAKEKQSFLKNYDLVEKIPFKEVRHGRVTRRNSMLNSIPDLVSINSTVEIGISKPIVDSKVSATQLYSEEISEHYNVKNSPKKKSILNAKKRKYLQKPRNSKVGRKRGKLSSKQVKEINKICQDENNTKLEEPINFELIVDDVESNKLKDLSKFECNAIESSLGKLSDNKNIAAESILLSVNVNGAHYKTEEIKITNDKNDYQPENEKLDEIEDVQIENKALDVIEADDVVEETSDNSYLKSNSNIASEVINSLVKEIEKRLQLENDSSKRNVPPQNVSDTEIISVPSTSDIAMIREETNQRDCYNEKCCDKTADETRAIFINELVIVESQKALDSQLRPPSAVSENGVIPTPIIDVITVEKENISNNPEVLNDPMEDDPSKDANEAEHNVNRKLEEKTYEEAVTIPTVEDVINNINKCDTNEQQNEEENLTLQTSRTANNVENLSEKKLEIEERPIQENLKETGESNYTVIDQNLPMRTDDKEESSKDTKSADQESNSNILIDNKAEIQDELNEAVIPKKIVETKTSCELNSGTLNDKDEVPAQKNSEVIAACLHTVDDNLQSIEIPETMECKKYLSTVRVEDKLDSISTEDTNAKHITGKINTTEDNTPNSKILCENVPHSDKMVHVDQEEPLSLTVDRCDMSQDSDISASKRKRSVSESLESVESDSNTKKTKNTICDNPGNQSENISGLFKSQVVVNVRRIPDLEEYRCQYLRSLRRRSDPKFKERPRTSKEKAKCLDAIVDKLVTSLRKNERWCSERNSKSHTNDVNPIETLDYIVSNSFEDIQTDDQCLEKCLSNVDLETEKITEECQSTKNPPTVVTEKECDQEVSSDSQKPIIETEKPIITESSETSLPETHGDEVEMPSQTPKITESHKNITKMEVRINGNVVDYGKFQRIETQSIENMNKISELEELPKAGDVSAIDESRESEPLATRKETKFKLKEVEQSEILADCQESESNIPLLPLECMENSDSLEQIEDFSQSDHSPKLRDSKTTLQDTQISKKTIEQIETEITQPKDIQTHLPENIDVLKEGDTLPVTISENKPVGSDKSTPEPVIQTHVSRSVKEEQNEDCLKSTGIEENCNFERDTTIRPQETCPSEIFETDSQQSLHCEEKSVPDDCHELSAHPKVLESKKCFKQQNDIELSIDSGKKLGNDKNCITSASTFDDNSLNNHGIQNSSTVSTARGDDSGSINQYKDMAQVITPTVPTVPQQNNYPKQLPLATAENSTNNLNECTLKVRPAKELLEKYKFMQDESYDTSSCSDYDTTANSPAHTIRNEIGSKRTEFSCQIMHATESYQHAIPMATCETVIEDSYVDHNVTFENVPSKEQSAIINECISSAALIRENVEEVFDMGPIPSTSAGQYTPTYPETKYQTSFDYQNQSLSHSALNVSFDADQFLSEVMLDKRLPYLEGCSELLDNASCSDMDLEVNSPHEKVMPILEDERAKAGANVTPSDMEKMPNLEAEGNCAGNENGIRNPNTFGAGLACNEIIDVDDPQLAEKVKSMGFAKIGYESSDHDYINYGGPLLNVTEQYNPYNFIDPQDYHFMNKVMANVMQQHSTAIAEASGQFETTNFPNENLLASARIEEGHPPDLHNPFPLSDLALCDIEDFYSSESISPDKIINPLKTLHTIPKSVIIEAPQKVTVKVNEYEFASTDNLFKDDNFVCPSTPKLSSSDSLIEYARRNREKALKKEKAKAKLDKKNSEMAEAFPVRRNTRTPVSAPRLIRRKSDGKEQLKNNTSVSSDSSCSSTASSPQTPIKQLPQKASESPMKQNNSLSNFESQEELEMKPDKLAKLIFATFDDTDLLNVDAPNILESPTGVNVKINEYEFSNKNHGNIEIKKEVNEKQKAIVKKLDFPLPKANDMLKLPTEILEDTNQNIPKPPPVKQNTPNAVEKEVIKPKTSDARISDTADEGKLKKANVNLTKEDVANETITKSNEKEKNITDDLLFLNMDKNTTQKFPKINQLLQEKSIEPDHNKLRIKLENMKVLQPIKRTIDSEKPPPLIPTTILEPKYETEVQKCKPDVINKPKPNINGAQFQKSLHTGSQRPENRTVSRASPYVRKEDIGKLNEKNYAQLPQAYIPRQESWKSERPPSRTDMRKPVYTRPERLNIQETSKSSLRIPLGNEKPFWDKNRLHPQSRSERIPTGDYQKPKDQRSGGCGYSNRVPQSRSERNTEGQYQSGDGTTFSWNKYDEIKRRTYGKLRNQVKNTHEGYHQLMRTTTGKVPERGKRKSPPTDRGGPPKLRKFDDVPRDAQPRKKTISPPDDIARKKQKDYDEIFSKLREEGNINNNFKTKMSTKIPSSDNSGSSHSSSSSTSSPFSSSSSGGNWFEKFPEEYLLKEARYVTFGTVTQRTGEKHS